jgi:hypothetical protein
LILLSDFGTGTVVVYFVSHCIGYLTHVLPKMLYMHGWWKDLLYY